MIIQTDYIVLLSKENVELLHQNWSTVFYIMRGVMDHRAKMLPIPLLSHVALGKVNPGGRHTSSYLPHIEANAFRPN